MKTQHCIQSIIIFPHLKMQVAPRGAAGVADVGDHLPGLYLLALGDADLAAMGIKGLQAAAVVDLDI